MDELLRAGSNTEKGETAQRKAEHLDILCTDAGVDRQKSYFDPIALKHRALPEQDLNAVDTSVVFMGKRLSFPLLISCMTGGDEGRIRMLNRNLATAAETTGVAMGIGSQRVIFENPKARESFQLRQYAPSALLFSNLGAVQLNYGFSVAECREALEILEADALYLHLNPLQEAVQPEGDTNFSGLAAKIGIVVRELAQPVVLKEVGSGIAPEDVALALAQGVRYIDVAGGGGASWSRIEYHRRSDSADDLGLIFEDWGIPTPTALQMLKPYRKQVTLIASGGIRSGIDMVKALILGASLCGVASPFLKSAMVSADSVIQAILRLKRQFATAMFLLGVSRVETLIGNETLLVREDGPKKKAQE